MFTRRALAFIESARANPFFLYLAYTAPHARSELGRDTGDGYPVPGYEPYENRDWPRPEKGYAAMVNMLDRDVGKLMTRLEQAAAGTRGEARLPDGRRAARHGRLPDAPCPAVR
jgi:uncharacterized sulfatase